MALLAVTQAVIQVVLPPRAVAKLTPPVVAKPPIADVLPSQAVAVKHLHVAVIQLRRAVALQSPDAAAKHPHVAVMLNRLVAANLLAVAAKSLADCSPACSASARKARAANQNVAAKWLRPAVAKYPLLADVTAAAIPVATLAEAARNAADC